MPPTLTWQLDRYRPLLLLQARQMRLDPRLQARFDASDLVHWAYVDALEGLPAFDGHTEAELIAWLRTILNNVAITRIRWENAVKRDPAAEIKAWKAVLDDSTACLDNWLVDKRPTPRDQAELNEQKLRLAAATEQLPEDQRDVIILRYLQKMSVAQIAAQLRRTEKAVAGLLRRGKRGLRELMSDEAKCEARSPSKPSATSAG
jgi:RNA polymerase sigma-70 factor (ECF subfamily)